MLRHVPAGDRGFEGTVGLDLRGSGGQSFGCFLVGGMDVKLTGEANDFVGKGMAGGDITIVPPPGHKYKVCSPLHALYSVYRKRRYLVELTTVT